MLINDEKSGDPLPLHLKKEGVHVYWIRSVEDEVFAQLKDEKERQLLEQPLPAYQIAGYSTKTSIQEKAKEQNHM